MSPILYCNLHHFLNHHNSFRMLGFLLLYLITPFQDTTKGDHLSKEEIKDFGEIILYFKDFQQKTKVSRNCFSAMYEDFLHQLLDVVSVDCLLCGFLQFGKLAKLKKDQENLPIYQYKEQIIHAARSFQVIIIAGDTGCGKSTQVRILYHN